MTKTESAHLTAQTVLLESAEQVLQLHSGAGVRLAIPETDALIMVGPQEWIAKNVPGVEAMVAGAQPSDDQWIFDLAVDHESRGNGLYGPITFSSTALVDFVRAVSTRLAATTQASTAQAERANADLHSAIMNLPCNPRDGWGGIQQTGYKMGHRDARHAAADLVNAQEDATSSTDAQAAAEVRDAALAWWESKRPVSWSEQEHAEVPEVNCAGDERSLARAVAAIRALRAGDTGGAR